MHINEFPYEILSSILEIAAKLNEHDGVNFTFGLSQPPPYLNVKPPIQRYLRGYVPPDMLKWDATAAIRTVCGVWHEWALKYAMKDVYLRRWQGSERWAELPTKRGQYKLYELIENPSGAAVYRDPYQSLRKTAALYDQYPEVAVQVRRLWFNGFFVPETDKLISSIVRSCPNLTTLSVPWTTLRHLDAERWSGLLGNNGGKPLQALELLARDLTEAQASDPQAHVDLYPLSSGIVDFSQLKKLKIFGDTTFMPITDADLYAIAKTATQLEEFHLTCISTITIDGVMAIVKSSQTTLRVLEHSPRSDDGFWHPHPGSPSSNEHLCDVLAACPRLETVSLSVPSMCASLFANDSVRWAGDFQVRAAFLCGHENARLGDSAPIDTLAALLQQSRRLIKARRRGSIPADLYIELFFADCIFEPQYCAVHGDFKLAQQLSDGAWPMTWEPSRKGPYGSTGLYGKEEEDIWGRISEVDFLYASRKKWVHITG